MNDPAQRARARWLCRRGMKELDVLLTAFMESQYDGLTPQAREAFHAVLEMPDPDLWACLVNNASAGDAAMDHVLERIRSRA